MTDHAINPDFRLVHLMFGLATHYGKLYAIPSQQKLCDLVKQFHGRRMCRRTVNRHLGGLERDGWLRRQRRHRVEGHRGMTFHSTLYTITRKTLRALASLRNGVRFLGNGARRRAAPKPCAITGTISVPVEQNHREGAPSAPPPDNNMVAVEQLDRIKGILRR